MALLGAGLARATDLPILIDSCNDTCLSWNGCELGLHINIAIAAMFVLEVCGFLGNQSKDAGHRLYPNA